jgi:hypothetical protein
LSFAVYSESDSPDPVLGRCSLQAQDGSARDATTVASVVRFSVSDARHAAYVTAQRTASEAHTHFASLPATLQHCCFWACSCSAMNSGSYGYRHSWLSLHCIHCVTGRAQDRRKASLRFGLDELVERACIPRQRMMRRAWLIDTGTATAGTSALARQPAWDVMSVWLAHVNDARFAHWIRTDARVSQIVRNGVRP